VKGFEASLSVTLYKKNKEILEICSVVVCRSVSKNVPSVSSTFSSIVIWQEENKALIVSKGQKDCLHALLDKTQHVAKFRAREVAS